MGYTPYKMVGHTLPGIKQRKPAAAKMKSFGTKDSDMPDDISTTPGKYAGGVGSSPAKGWFSKIAKGAKKLAGKALDPLGLKGKIKKKLGIGGNKKLEARVAALEASAGAGAAAAAPVEGGVAGAAADPAAAAAADPTAVQDPAALEAPADRGLLKM